MHHFSPWAMACVLLATPALQAAEVQAELHKIDDKGIGAVIGTVVAKDTPAGLMLIPNLKELPAGNHGFHVHESPDCGPKEKDGKMTAGLAAGSHYDPANTGKHLGPEGPGHLGDLPVLKVTTNGYTTDPVIAGKVKTADLAGRSLMVHAEDDNYGDKPGGARIACGAFK